MDNVAADAAVFHLLEILGHVDRPSAAVAGDDRGDSLHQVTEVGFRGRNG